MYRMPSHRKKGKKGNAKIDLVPIMDSVFIFIFFMLMSANFVKVFEISSDIPIVSTQEPPIDKKPLALTIEVANYDIKVLVGVPSQPISTIAKLSDTEMDLEKLHTVLIDLKKKNVNEEMAILMPSAELTYEQVVNLMDTVRLVRPTDETIYRTGKDGVQEVAKTLFGDVIFGNTSN